MVWELYGSVVRVRNRVTKIEAKGEICAKKEVKIKLKIKISLKIKVKSDNTGCDFSSRANNTQLSNSL